MTRIRITHRLEPDTRENEGEREEDTQVEQVRCDRNGQPRD